ncbi:hypothetical protein [Roseobacter sp.]|uniref:hypothetical protein n=1 Tax=Roseobacter sp. TaxID=1907202 RepID=UPI0029668177|nr:hypothetical protein [Roseobacter sp.]MDW3181440.1 hypothetical protein [Roseobacter sp.]
MTEMAPSVAHRFCVGITSVLRRCVASGLFGVCLLPNEAFAEYTGHDMIRAAFENCVPKVESAAVVGVDQYWRFEALNVHHPADRKLSAVDRVWVGDTDAWYLHQRRPLSWSLECQVLSYSFVVANLAATWNAYLTNNEDGFELKRLATISRDEWGVRAVRDVDNGTTEAIFCAIKDVGEAPWATVDVRWIWSDRNKFMERFCENWPKECV